IAMAAMGLAGLAGSGPVLRTAGGAMAGRTERCSPRSITAGPRACQPSAASSAPTVSGRSLRTSSHCPFHRTSRPNPGKIVDRTPTNHLFEAHKQMRYRFRAREKRFGNTTAAVTIAVTLFLVALGVIHKARGAGATFTLASPDLPAGKPIPERFTANAFGCHGPNESPALKWRNAPAGTKS